MLWVNRVFSSCNQYGKKGGFTQLGGTEGRGKEEEEVHTEALRHRGREGGRVGEEIGDALFS
jgi:hypothetical protein